jgi:predicted nucleic acid-binding protein
MISAGVVADANVLLSAALGKAARLLAARDPEDAHPLALARALSLPIWSNDSDLANVGVDCCTTAQLLKVLETR